LLGGGAAAFQKNRNGPSAPSSVGVGIFIESRKIAVSGYAEYDHSNMPQLSNQTRLAVIAITTALICVVLIYMALTF
jgi:hypothetical protein